MRDALEVANDTIGALQRRLDDALDDVARLHREKMEFVEANIALRTAAARPEGREQVLEDAAKACERKAAGFALEGTVKETSYTQQQQAEMAFWQSDGLRIAAGIVRELKRHSPQDDSRSKP